MKRIARLSVAALAMLTFSLVAQGQQDKEKVVGKLKDVQGLVTVSSGDKLSTAVNDAPLISGSRIITTSSGGVRLNFDIGCDVTLKPNEAITVKDGLDCAALLASVQPVGTVPLVVAGGVTALDVGIGVTGALVFVGALHQRNNRSPGN